MKDIGSIFPLYDSDLKIDQSDLIDVHKDGKILFSLCREALYAIASSLGSSEKIVLLPSYTCDTVITPFKELGWKCVYYPVDLQLRIDVFATLNLYSQSHANLILVHPYYGKDLDGEEVALLETIHEKGCKIALDLTQCIFTTQRLQCVDYYVGSYRKWFAIPDGGYLEPKVGADLFDSELVENDEFVSLQRDAMYLRGLYFQTDNEEVKGVSRRLNKMAVEMTDYHVFPHVMSAFSCGLLKKENKRLNQEKRLANYSFLLDKLITVDGCRILCGNMAEVSSAPLYFMIYVDDRITLQRMLSEQHIYAPVIWPVVYEEVLVNETVKYIYDHILAIPIDQRYDEGDMAKIVSIIKGYYNA